MTEQEKKILFQAICESFPHGLKCTTKAYGWPGVYSICGCIGNKIILDCPKEVEGDDIWLVQNIVPYLRPMSSMTDEEFQKLRSICPHSMINKTNVTGWFVGINGSDYGRISRIDEISKFIDWLNAYHFDYRGLIPMGLALEAPEGMYK